MEKHDFVWDERGIELVEKSPWVVITREGAKVTALNVSTGKKAIAKCSPEDTFDFMVGAKLALERLEEIEKVKPLAVGDTVAVIDTGKLYSTDCNWVLKHVGDEVLRLHFAYGDRLDFPTTIKQKGPYVIRVIAGDKAYIQEQDSLGYKRCYVIGLHGLKKCTS